MKITITIDTGDADVTIIKDDAGRILIAPSSDCHIEKEAEPETKFTGRDT